MEKWIKNCEADHEKCSHHSGAPLPTRVVDIGHSNDAIRLLETNEASGSYVCLSHCWGESSTILCTRDTYDGFTNNIPWNLLPSLFRDAIEVCRRLKIRYLWVDKLCIIQHDKEDWAREGSKMAQIYEGSFLTIAALTSKNDRDPLFFKDDTNAPSQRSHTGLMEDDTVYTVYSRIPVNYHPGNQGRQAELDEHYPLMTRAWVYQERLLAPRILYFGKELSWECRETSECECSGMNVGLKYAHSQSLTSCSTSQLYLQWQNMVESYTSLRLSHEDDRLPAFSGLAQQFQRHLQSTYLAGLWKNNLMGDLLWSSLEGWVREEPRYCTRKPEKWRAPSWSWASVEGPIDFFSELEKYKTLTYKIDVITAECTPSSVDQLGAVLQGRLVVKGRSRQVLLRHTEDCIGTKTRHYSSEIIDVQSYSVKNHFDVENQSAMVDYDLIEQGLMKPNSAMSVHCLEIAGTHYMQSVSNDESREEYSLQPAYRSWSLLLHCVGGNNFERVGLVKQFYLTEKETPPWDSMSEDIFTII